MTNSPRNLHELLATVREFELSHETWTEKKIASTILPSVTDAEKDLIARELIQRWTWDIRRKRQLAVERAAQRDADEAILIESQSKKEKARKSEAEELEAMFYKLLEKPERMYAKSRQDGRDYSVYLSRSKLRMQFRKWCGDRFDEWHDRAYLFVKSYNEPGLTDLFLSDWHEDGPEAYYREKQLRFVMKAIAETAERVRLEVTEELLGEQFALGDGRRVTWGRATVADHEQRITMLAKNAAANVEAAARHQAAIDMIKRAGAEHLGDLAD